MGPPPVGVEDQLGVLRGAAAALLADGELEGWLGLGGVLLAGLLGKGSAHEAGCEEKDLHCDLIVFKSGRMTKVRGAEWGFYTRGLSLKKLCCYVRTCRNSRYFGVQGFALLVVFQCSPLFSDSLEYDCRKLTLMVLRKCVTKPPFRTFRTIELYIIVIYRRNILECRGAKLKNYMSFN